MKKKPEAVGANLENLEEDKLYVMKTIIAEGKERWYYR